MLDLVDRVQAAYPRIWHAAHVRHPGRQSALSERDQRLLAHLGSTPRDTAGLARHLGIAPSTLSEHLGDLEERGLVARRPHPDDGRRVQVLATESGHTALRTRGPLDDDRLRGALERLGPRAEQVVVALEALADALVRP